MVKKFEIFVSFFLVLLAGIACGYTWRMVHEMYEPIQYEYPVLSGEDRAEHYRLLKKHGLDASVVYQDVLGEYFIRDGKRCRF